MNCDLKIKSAHVKTPSMNLKKGGMLWLNYTKGSPTVRSTNYYLVTSEEKSNGLN